MKPILLFLSLLAPAIAAKPNVLLICVDDLRPELKSMGADYIHSPAMDALVKSGRAFTRHYVQAPTCGASRYTLLTGRYGTSGAHRNNDALMASAKDAGNEPFSLPRQFRENGYRTVSIGKISHYPGGLGGQDWNDTSKIEMPGAWDISLMPTDPWRNPKEAMHSYANGKTREHGITPANEHADGDDLTYTDGWITRESLKKLEDLSKMDSPFFLAVGLMKPHLPFTCPKKYLALYEGVKLPPILHPEKPSGLSTWQPSGEFRGQYFHGDRDPVTDPAYADELRRSYAACVSYTDSQIAQLMAYLEKLDLAKNTIVVLWGDHGWHLGEHAVWGKHTLFEESLRAPLVIRAPGMKHAGQTTAGIVETIDIYPTLCELAGVPVPKGLSGESLTHLLEDPKAESGEAISYYQINETIRTDRHRLIRHNLKDGAAYELYDHASPEKETKNLAAENPDLVRELTEKLEAALGN